MHAPQIQGFFDLPMDHLHAAPVFLDYFQSIQDELGSLVVVSPDVGNVKMAKNYAAWLGADLAIIDKRRESGSEVVSSNIIGNVEGKTVLMVDDMISTAGTICEAARLLKSKGCNEIIAAATHPVLVGLAMERLAEAPISRLVVTDTIPCGTRCKPIEDKLIVLSISKLLGEAIHRIHHHLSVSSLFRKLG